jgi:hypothetical protein
MSILSKGSVKSRVLKNSAGLSPSRMCLGNTVELCASRHEQKGLCAAGSINVRNHGLKRAGTE